MINKESISELVKLANTEVSYIPEHITETPVVDVNDEVNNTKPITSIPKMHSTRLNNISDYNVVNNYKSRDLSWLQFNERVLDISCSDDMPIQDQLNFVSISANNLDEFMSVRCGYLKNRLKDDSYTPIDKNLDNSREFKLVKQGVKELMGKMYKKYNEINENLSQYNTKIVTSNLKNILTDKDKKKINKYFNESIYYRLTPMVFDESRPFPLVMHNTLNIACLIQDDNCNMIGIIRIPENIPRLFKIHHTEGERELYYYIPIENIIARNFNKLFINKKILSYTVFRVIRNSDVTIENDDKFLVDEMEDMLNEREIGNPLFLEMTTCKEELYKLIHRSLDVNKRMIFNVDKNLPIKLSNINSGLDLHTEEKVKLEKFTPQISPEFWGEKDMFEVLDRKDVILHHPYETFEHVTELINQAADNPDVLVIKQTLYRVSKDSPIMKALIRAANKGKQVTCLFEVKARFNEQENIKWAERLEQAGGYVIYGVEGLKTHCKMTMIVKKFKKEQTKTYCHLGTGNYNNDTSKIYTDISYFTSNNDICEDVSKLFNTLSGFSEPRLKKLISAPHNLRNGIMKLIVNEIASVEQGKQGEIIIKCNSLSDKDIIDALYYAARKGVKITLIIRGICCILPCENIKIISVIGRFLEHSRIYYFKNSPKPYFIASADMMTRNIDKRIEIMIPIIHEPDRVKIKNILDTYICDQFAYEYKLADDGSVKIEHIGTNNIAESSQYVFIKNIVDMSKYNKVKVFIRGAKNKNKTKKR